MSDPLEQTREQALPHDLEVERQLLCALLCLDQYERNQATLKVQSDMFHDPFHVWLYKAIRRARMASTVRELLDHLYREPAPQWILRSRGYWIADVLCDRRGVLRTGEVRMITAYVTKLEALRRRRERIVELEKELLVELHG